MLYVFKFIIFLQNIGDKTQDLTHNRNMLFLCLSYFLAICIESFKLKELSLVDSSK